MRQIFRVRALIAAFAVCGMLAGGVMSARAYPERPINLIVPWGVGGGGDRVGRVIAGLLASKLGVSVPVINVTGASGQVGLNKVLNEPTDGYNIIEITSDTYILFARSNSRFKVSDFASIAIVDQQPSGFFLRYDSPWKTWHDVPGGGKVKDSDGRGLRYWHSERCHRQLFQQRLATEPRDHSVRRPRPALDFGAGRARRSPLSAIRRPRCILVEQEVAPHPRLC